MPHKFPDGFLWGTATAAHQVEGNNKNDWTEWEKKTARKKAKTAVLKEWPEYLLKNHPNPCEEENYISGRAAGHYSRYEEDFDLARGLSTNAHRFSVEWSRIEPRPGEFDEAEIDHYRRVIMALRRRGLEPFVTLWHFTNPLWIRDLGGWENPETVHHFARYAQRMAREFGGDVRFWMPLNEPGTYIGMGYILGLFPPGKRNFFTANKVFGHMMRAHREAYQAIHKEAPSAQVGFSHYAVFIESKNGRLHNAASAFIADYLRNWRFLDAVRNETDFLGIQYYHHDRVGFGWHAFEVANENKWINDMGWEIYPWGIYKILLQSAEYGKPIYITENGVADARDEHRARFIKEHLFWIWKAIQKGADVRGYFHWSLLDNFEWAFGYWPRFGLFEVNYKTFERVPRPSAEVYGRVAKSNALKFEPQA